MQGLWSDSIWRCVQILIAINFDTCILEHLFKTLLAKLGKHFEGVIKTEDSVALQSLVNVSLSSLPVEIVPRPTIWAEYVRFGLLLSNAKQCRNLSNKYLTTLTTSLDRAKEIQTLLVWALKLTVKDRGLVKFILGNRDTTQGRHIWNRILVDLCNQRNLSERLAKNLRAIRSQMWQCIKQGLTCLDALVINDLVQLSWHA